MSWIYANELICSQYCKVTVVIAQGQGSTWKLIYILLVLQISGIGGNQSTNFINALNKSQIQTTKLQLTVCFDFQAEFNFSLAATGLGQCWADPCRPYPLPVQRISLWHSARFNWVYDFWELPHECSLFCYSPEPKAHIFILCACLLCIPIFKLLFHWPG